MGKLPTELVKMWLKLLMEHCYAIVVGCAAADEGERESVVEQQAYIFFYCSYISSADRLLVAASRRISVGSMHDTHLHKSSAGKRSYYRLREEQAVSSLSSLPPLSAHFRTSPSLPETPNFWASDALGALVLTGLPYPMQ